MKTRQMMTAAEFVKASLAFCLLFLAGCAISTPRDAQLRALGAQTFGSDASLKVHNIFYGGPSGSSMSDEFNENSDQAALVVDMKGAKSRKVDLVVSCSSSRHAAATIWAALHDPALKSGLQQLRLLFVGDPQDAARLKPVVEATGATFYFQQK
jgi:hypothetical protein